MGKKPAPDSSCFFGVGPLPLPLSPPPCPSQSFLELGRTFHLESFYFRLLEKRIFGPGGGGRGRRLAFPRLVLPQDGFFRIRRDFPDRGLGMVENVFRFPKLGVGVG